MQNKSATFIAVSLCVVMIVAALLMQSVIQGAALGGQAMYGPWNPSQASTEQNCKEFFADKMKESNRKLSACISENTSLRSQLETRSKTCAAKTK